jgi:putative flippase GtrA
MSRLRWQRWRSGGFFLVVGAVAALTHLLVFELSKHQLWPEVANALGFAVAFGVSFAGHRWLSFSDTTTPLLQSLRRFGVTSLAGFACNELCFMLLFRLWGWPSLPALLVAMLVAAVQTFVLSRFWAFMR